MNRAGFAYDINSQNNDDIETSFNKMEIWEIMQAGHWEKLGRYANHRSSGDLA